MKQTIEIEVPEGKKAIIEGSHIRYIDIEYWKSKEEHYKAEDDTSDGIGKLMRLSEKLKTTDSIAVQADYNKLIIELLNKK